MLEKIVNAVNIPVVASGGAGSIQHFIDLFKRVDVGAGLGASVFHFGEIEIKSLKQELKNSGIEVRL
jgi:cyclase